MSQEKNIVTVTMNPAVDLACTVPNFTAGEVNRVTRFRHDPGGKGVNIAKLLRQFGLPVTATGFLGADNPRIFEQLFHEKEIVDAFVRVPGETRTDIKVLDPEALTTTDINFPGVNPTPEHLAALQALVGRLSVDAGIVVIAGSVPASLSRDVVAELVATVRSNGARAVVDTSGPPLSPAIRAVPALIKPNAFELGEHLGRSLRNTEEIVAEARALLRTGIETVVVSLGAGGAVFVEGDEVLLARPPHVEVVSTVGAGDAMVASLCAGLARGMSLEARARLATAVSAAVVAQPGPDLSNLDAVRALEAQVVIEPLKY